MWWCLVATYTTGWGYNSQKFPETAGYLILKFLYDYFSCTVYIVTCWGPWSCVFCNSVQSPPPSPNVTWNTVWRTQSISIGTKKEHSVAFRIRQMHFWPGLPRPPSRLGRGHPFPYHHLTRRLDLGGITLSTQHPLIFSLRLRLVFIPTTVLIIDLLKHFWISYGRVSHFMQGFEPPGPLDKDIKCKVDWYIYSQCTATCN